MTTAGASERARTRQSGARRTNSGANASAAPACRAPSSSLRRAGGHDATSHPSSHGIAATWADDDTGASSHPPWINPSATTSGSGGTPLAPAHAEPHDEQEDRRDHEVVDVVQVLLPALPVLAGLLADEAEQEHPRRAAGDRQQREAPERHPRDAGRQGDERADDRQQ